MALVWLCLNTHLRCVDWRSGRGSSQGRAGAVSCELLGLAALVCFLIAGRGKWPEADHGKATASAEQRSRIVLKLKRRPSAACAALE